MQEGEAGSGAGVYKLSLPRQGGLSPVFRTSRQEEEQWQNHGSSNVQHLVLFFPEDLSP